MQETVDDISKLADVCLQIAYEYADKEIVALEEKAAGDDQVIIVSQLYNRSGNIYPAIAKNRPGKWMG